MMTSSQENYVIVTNYNVIATIAKLAYSSAKKKSNLISTLLVIHIAHSFCCGVVIIFLLVQTIFLLLDLKRLVELM